MKEIKTTTIRITTEAHEKLRDLAYIHRTTITELINGFVGVKNRNKIVYARNKKALTTFEKLMLKKKS